jgi:hypothetical protein
MLKVICILPFLAAVAWAKPISPTEVIKGEQLKRAKIRWVRQEKALP